MVKLEVIKGNTALWEVTAKDDDGTVFDLTGAEITFSVKNNLNDTTALIERKNAAAGGGSDEIEDIDLVNGRFDLKLVASNTSSLDSGTYKWDFKFIMGSTIKNTQVGIFIISQGIS